MKLCGQNIDREGQQRASPCIGFRIYVSDQSESDVSPPEYSLIQLSTRWYQGGQRGPFLRDFEKSMGLPLIDIGGEFKNCAGIGRENFEEDARFGNSPPISIGGWTTFILQNTRGLIPAQEEAYIPKKLLECT
jgi:hypothetical protein